MVNFLIENFTVWKDCQNQTSKPKHGPSLDEITNRVFEELLQGKGDKSRVVSDQGSVRVSCHTLIFLRRNKYVLMMY